MAFHPYPRLIPSVFNPSGFGPPRGLTPASAWPWVDHPASRPRSATQTPLEARFRFGSLASLTSPRNVTRWLILQKARRHTGTVLRLLVGARFQALFHSPLGVLFTFPARYSFAIGHGRVLSLGGWSPLLRTGFHVPGPTRDHGAAGRGDPRTGLSPASAGLSMPFRFPPPFRPRAGAGSPRMARPTTPTRQRLPGLNARVGLGWPAFARRYSRGLG